MIEQGNLFTVSYISRCDMQVLYGFTTQLWPNLHKNKTSKNDRSKIAGETRQEGIVRGKYNWELTENKTKQNPSKVLRHLFEIYEAFCETLVSCL